MVGGTNGIVVGIEQRGPIARSCFAGIVGLKVSQRVRVTLTVFEVRPVGVQHDELFSPFLLQYTVNERQQIFVVAAPQRRPTCRLRHTDEAPLVGFLPEYRAKGANVLLFYDLIPRYNAHGIKWGETQVEMESNANVQSQWEAFDTHLHKRRKCYKKFI